MSSNMSSAAATSDFLVLNPIINTAPIATSKIGIAYANGVTRTSGSIDFSNPAITPSAKLSSLGILTRP